MGVSEVVKGGFEFSISGAVLTVAAKGVTKMRFPKAAAPGEYCILDLTGKSYSWDTDSYPVDAGCGITTTVDWASSMPMFVYLGNEDNTSANVFAFNTRDPRMRVTPAAGLINDTAAVGATAQSQNHINSWKADDAGIAAKPCICIGSHKVTWETDAAPVADVWELVALDTDDGFGKFQEGVAFTFPVGQNGAEAGKHFTSTDGATALTFDPTNSVIYTLSRNGYCSCTHSHATQSANGADGTAVKWFLPYSGVSTSGVFPVGSGVGIVATNQVIMLPWFNVAGGAHVLTTSTNSGTTTDRVLDNGFTDTGDNVYFQITYKAF